MEKTFSKIEISVIKSTAKNVAQYVAKKQKVEAQIKEVEERVAEAIRKRAAEKIEKLEAEKKGYQSIIDSMNAPVKKITEVADAEGNIIREGYTTEDLIDIKKEATGSMDPKTGKEIFKTVYVLKYPETVVPPTTEGAGSDYDEDKEKFDPMEWVNKTPENESECPTHEEDPEEMPEELAEQQAEVAEEAENADPFADIDPFNQ